MEAIFLHDWAKPDWDGRVGLDAMKRDFEINDEHLVGVNILLATYTYEHYEGSAFVLFERGGDLFEVYASHCSCYGLEGQWEPKPVTAMELRANLDKSAALGSKWDKHDAHASALGTPTIGNDATHDASSVLCSECARHPSGNGRPQVHDAAPNKGAAPCGPMSEP
jgi:hypothetical protein